MSISAETGMEVIKAINALHSECDKNVSEYQKELLNCSITEEEYENFLTVVNIERKTISVCISRVLKLVE